MQGIFFWWGNKCMRIKQKVREFYSLLQFCVKNCDYSRTIWVKWVETAIVWEIRKHLQMYYCSFRQGKTTWSQGKVRGFCLLNMWEPWYCNSNSHIGCILIHLYILLADDKEESITEVHHEQMSPTLVVGYQQPGSYVRPIVYGNMQKEDFDETYRPVLRVWTVH